MAERQMLSKTYPLGAKGAKSAAAVVCLLVGLALTAKAQEPTYSADSLTATFEKGSHVSLKGTEIFLRDVVVELRIGKVLFKMIGRRAEKHFDQCLACALRCRSRLSS